MPTETAGKWRPFEVTIVEAIRRCPGPPSRDILVLLELIESTEIRKSHDQIVAAIDEYFGFLDPAQLEQWPPGVLGVRESVLEQKRRWRKEEEQSKRLLEAMDGMTHGGQGGLH